MIDIDRRVRREPLEERMNVMDMDLENLMGRLWAIKEFCDLEKFEITRLNILAESEDEQGRIIAFLRATQGPLDKSSLTNRVRYNINGNAVAYAGDDNTLCVVIPYYLR